MKSKIIVIAISVILLASIAAELQGQGIIIPDRPRRHIRIQDFDLKSQHVTVEIDNQTAVTTVEQVFYNPNRFVMEAEYIFILPENAVATGLSLWMDGKKVKGELLDKDQARRIYRSIVARMKDPALLEYIGRNMFKAHIYPIPARGEQKIEIRYHQQLGIAGGVVEYRYPLRAEKLYKKEIGSFSLEAKLKSAQKIKSVYCPTHELDIVKKDDHNAIAGYEKKHLKPTRDIQLFYTLSDKEFGLNLLTYRPDADEDGYFMLLLAPRTEISSRDVQPKDVVFVLDRSGSMEDDDKIKQAVNSLKFGVKNLNAEDRFNIVTFATDKRQFKEKLMPANDKNKEKALAFLKKTEAAGGTNIYDSLKAALELLKGDKGLKTLVFLTDGLPTVGETRTDRIIEMVKEKSGKNLRIFCFGLGYDVNTHLLDMISGRNRGESDYIKPGENMEVKISAFFDKINCPVMTGIEIDFGKIDVSKLYPIDMPDLFKGSQLVAYGRYEADGNTAVTLEGTISGKERKFVYDARFAEEDDEHSFISYLWASRRIGYLLDEIRLHGENDELVKEIVKLSKKFGIVTPYTSYLVAEDEPRRHHRRLPPPPRRRWHYDSDKGGRGTGAPPSLSQAPASGESAVRAAEEMKKLKDEDTVSERYEAEDIKHVGSKTFYLKGDVWTDSEYEESMTAVKIKFGSDEYFDLIKDKPELAKYLSIGTKVIVVYKNKAYEIYE